MLARDAAGDICDWQYADGGGILWEGRDPPTTARKVKVWLEESKDRDRKQEEEARMWWRVDGDGNDDDDDGKRKRRVVKSLSESRDEAMKAASGVVAAAPRVRDDPVENGRELAMTKDLLPSDGWRARGVHGGTRDGTGVSVVSREDKEMMDLSWALNAADGILSLGSIAHDEPIYSVRVVSKRRRKGRAMTASNREVIDTHGNSSPAAALHEPEQIEDSRSVCWEGVFEELEAQGWVPVAGWVGEGEEDELASIAESWVMAACA